MRRTLWIYIGVLVLLLAAVSAWRLRPSMPEGSEFYQRYCDMPGVRVGFVEDFPLNDSVTCDVTTFEALDDEGWALMVEALGLKQQLHMREMIDSMSAVRSQTPCNHERDLSFWLTGRFHPEQHGDKLPTNTGDTADNYMGSLYYRWFSVYHCVNKDQIDAVFDAHFEQMDNHTMSEPLTGL